ncbi:MAG: MotA/TolQ/ExbB proton channel family protein [Treponema sp.]|jgi:biopolymer transport protein ExbB|nr:MotA/TolQ/ExbB proton channel family protein [Treponema sp.]
MKALIDFAFFMNAGGPINWIIAALYLAVLALGSNRGVYFWRTRPGGKTAEGAFPLNQAGRVTRRYIENRTIPKAELDEVIEREGAVIMAEMERGSALLGFIGTASPLLGLLGTITGLMRAFAAIESLGGNVDIAALSGGIREAMITTATGLVTAITAAALAKFFDSLSAARAREMSLALSLVSAQRSQA